MSVCLNVCLLVCLIACPACVLVCMHLCLSVWLPASLPVSSSQKFLQRFSSASQALLKNPVKSLSRAPSLSSTSHGASHTQEYLWNFGAASQWPLKIFASAQEPLKILSMTCQEHPFQFSQTHLKIDSQALKSLARSPGVQLRSSRISQCHLEYISDVVQASTKRLSWCLPK